MTGNSRVAVAGTNDGYIARRDSNWSLPAFSMILGCVLSVLVCAFVNAKDQLDEKATYIRHAIEHDGNVERGKQLFRTHGKLLCTDCHNISGFEKSGPNLDGVA